MTWIQTFSGVQFWPLAPEPKDVRLEDIAHALSNTCRFTGHCAEFYSVAQHSVHVADAMLAHWAPLPEDYYRVGLLHDAAEAYLPDIARPIKGAWQEFRQIENRLLEVIHEALDVHWSPSAGMLVKRWDDVLLATEARDLMGPPPAPWAELPKPLDAPIVPLPPTEARTLWLQKWAQF